jgi:hypothetical protein
MSDQAKPDEVEGLRWAHSRAHEALRRLDERIHTWTEGSSAFEARMEREAAAHAQAAAAALEAAAELRRRAADATEAEAEALRAQAEAADRDAATSAAAAARAQAERAQRQAEAASFLAEDLAARDRVEARIEELDQRLWGMGERPRMW